MHQEICAVRQQSFRTIQTLPALVLLGFALSANAALREWSGAVNNDNRWSRPGNWVNGGQLGAPSPGDDLLFLSQTPHPNNQNDYPSGTTFNSIELRGAGGGGYNIGGNSIALNSGIRVENNSGQSIDHAINIAFILNSNQVFTIQNDVGIFSLPGGIVLNGKELTFDVVASIDTLVSGIISGAGGLVKTGAGPLTLSGNNTHTGPTTLNGGALWINGTQPASPVLLISGTLKGTGTVGTLTSTGNGGPGAIALSPGASPGLLTCSNLALNASTTLQVELNGTIAGAGHDQLNVSGSVNLGYAGLSVSLGFTPVLGDSFIIINNDGTDPVVGAFLGLPQGATFLVGATPMQISYTAGSGNDVSLTATVPPLPPLARIWDGGGSDANWLTAQNWQGDAQPIGGDDLVFPPGAARLLTTNDYGAGKVFNSITVSNTGYALVGSRISLNAGVSVRLGSGVVDISAPFTLNSNQTFRAEGGTLNLNAQTDLGGNALTLWTDTEIQTTFTGGIAGSGAIIKDGSGFVTFGPGISYAGVTEVRQGTLRLAGGSLGSTASGTIVSNGATLMLLEASSIAEPLTLYGSLATGSGGAGSSTWSGPITLPGMGAQISTSPQLTVSGIISGSGSLRKTGSGNLVLTAANTYSGPTTNAGGNLFVDGFQPQSPVFLVSGMLSGTGTVGTVQAPGFLPTTLSPGGTAQLQGVLNCSNVILSSVVTFRTHLSGSSPGSGYDQLNVNGSVALGSAALSVVLGFDPAPGSALIIIANDGSDPVTGTFFNLPEGSTLTANEKIFQISYTGGTGNDVVLTLVNPTPAFASINKSGNGQMLLQATGGLSGANYSILATTNLASSLVWSNIGSAVADSGGIFTFTDTNAPLFPRRFYRALSP